MHPEDTIEFYDGYREEPSHRYACRACIETKRVESSRIASGDGFAFVKPYHPARCDHCYRFVPDAYVYRLATSSPSPQSR